MSGLFSLLTRVLKLTSVLSLTLLVICVARVLIYFPNAPPAELCTSDTPSPAFAKLFPRGRHVRLSEETRPGLISRFSQALKFKTITTGKNSYDAQQTLALISFLQQSFPRIHSTAWIKRQLVANYSLLYEIRGSDETLKPFLLASHLDVVPVEEDKWSVPAFEGLLKDGFIYGRGTLDIKDTLMAIMESLEYLIESGFQPKRSFFLAFGHDEEGSGFEGAAEMAKIIKHRLTSRVGENDGSLLYLLDEGTFIVKGDAFPGISSSIAFVGVSEKGYLTVKATVRGEAGHSSMTPRETSIVRLSRAVTKFTSDAHPSRFTQGPEKGIFENLAIHASFPFKLIYGNLWLFKLPLSYILSLSPLGNALVRTTSAVTVIHSGIKENVIPSVATALINHRIHPVDSIESVLKTDKELINDEDIELELNEGFAFEPHPVSPFDSQTFGYNVVKKSIESVFPSTIVVPGIMVASTDTKWYLNLTSCIYRFSPAHLEKSDAKLFHGHDERISVQNYEQIVNFYHHLMVMSDRKELFKEQIVKRDEL